MGWFSSDTYQDNYDNYNDHPAPHEASLSHELLGGAVAFEAARAYENHCARNGQPASHALAKELVAGFAGAAVDRVAETKGRDAWDSYSRNRALDNARERLDVTDVDVTQSVNVTQYDNNY